MTNPFGYSLKLDPKSRGDLLQVKVADKAITITKSVVQKYIDGCFSPRVLIVAFSRR